MKAQSKFGGTKPSNKATKVRQAGYDIGKKGSPNISATKGVNNIGNNRGKASKNTTAPRRNLGIPQGPIRAGVTVKQVGTTSKGSANDHRMFRDPTLTTKDVTSRPHLPGKEDNRTSWK